MLKIKPTRRRAGQRIVCLALPLTGLAGIDDRHKPQQGDEARLFAEFNNDLVRSVGRSVHTSPEVIEDACSIAWAQISPLFPVGAGAAPTGEDKRPA